MVIMRETKSNGGFLLCLLINLEWSIPAWILLALHFWLNISIWWFVGGLAFWILSILVDMWIVGWAASCGYRHDTVLESQDDIRLYCLTPFTDGFAYLGLCDKFIGKITATDITPDGFTLREKGDFEFCSERKVNAVTIDGETAEFVQDGIFCKVQTASEKRSAVVQISYESC